ncbi:phospholipase D-like domain-containing protein, partial [Nonomuraea roseola]
MSSGIERVVMFYLDPRDLVTDALVERCQGALGSEVVLERTQLLDVLSEILGRMDSFPMFDREPDSVERSALAERLLTDAIVRVLKMSGYTHIELGYLLDSVSVEPLERRIRSVRAVPINFASAEDLDMLPGVGSALAELMLNERRRHGPFLSAQDLIDRVDGIGLDTGHRLAHALSFRFPESDLRELPGERDLGQAIALLVSPIPGEDIVLRLKAALDQLATALAAESPVELPEVPHAVVSDINRDEFPSTAIESLAGPAYFNRVSELLDGAAQSIDVCMFHIAFPSPDHPTRKLLDGLINAHGRGVTVRVLIDRDRPNDPYQSTVVNSPTLAFLNQNTELCRFDDESVLLHSKYLIIDEELVVLGSHNWSAGSFFNFDDLSVVVHSADYAGYMTTRFSAQWAD